MSVPIKIETISQITTNAMCIGSELNMKDVTGPKGMLEHVIDIFTLGGVRREKENIYKSVISELRTFLQDKKATPDSLKNMEKIELYLNEMTIMLRPDSRYNAMQITVSRGNEKAEGFVPDSNFTALCTSIMLRENLLLSRDNDLLTPDGKINLSDITDNKLSYDFDNIIKNLMDIPKSLRCHLPAHLQKSLVNIEYLESKKDHSTTKNGIPDSEQKFNFAAQNETGSGTVSLIESRKNSDSDFESYAEHFPGIHSDSDTLSLSSLLEGDNENTPDIYNFRYNQRSCEDLLIKVS